MTRTLIITAAFIASMSLITIAYSQTHIAEALNQPTLEGPGQNCFVGSQNPATVVADHTDHSLDKCWRYPGFIQGACGCDLSSGQLKNRDNPVCKEALTTLFPSANSTAHLSRCPTAPSFYRAYSW